MNIDPSKIKVQAVYSSEINKGGHLPLRADTEAVSEPKEKVTINKSLFKSIVPVREEEPKQNEGESKAIRNDEYRFKDGFDSSRDLAGISWKEGKPDEPYRFSVKLTHLKPGAEHGNLDVYTLISLGKRAGRVDLPDNMPGITTQPWNISVGKYDSKNFSAIDDNGTPIPQVVNDIKFNEIGKCVDFSLNKNVLRDMGWKDGEPLKLQAFTAKDFVKQVTDTLDDVKTKPWSNDGKLTRFVDTANPQSLKAKRDDDWSDDVVYFVLTDRFHDGDKTNNLDVNKDDLARYHGGDLQGLIEKMDYIKSQGVSTLWISPVMDNQTDFVNSSGYHGYWPVDFYKVDEHQGDMDKFKEMVDTAHRKGLKIMLDLPLNHTAWEHPFRNDPDKKDWFHQIGDIQNWNDPYQVENGSMYGLPDLAQENPKVYNYLMDVCKYWIDEGKVDGFRLDAVMHVNKGFWEGFSQDIREYAGPDFYMVGEVFHGDPNVVKAYQDDGMAGLFDLPLYFTTKEVFAHDASMKNLADKMTDLNNKYDNPSLMSGILDNHDTNRFITEAGGGEAGREKLQLALGFLFSINRIPAIYFGTEQAMEGHNEAFGKYHAENRKDMEFGKDPKMEAYTKSLINIRNSSKALKSGAMMEMWKDDKVYSFSRMTPDEEVVVVLNNGYDTQHRDIPLRAESSLKNGDVLKDVLSGAEVTVTEGKIHVAPERKKAMILMPKTLNR